MKTITFKRNSWHHELAIKFDRNLTRDYYDDWDICSYTRAVLMGVFWIVVLLGMSTIASFILVDFFLGLLVSLWYGTLVWYGIGIIIPSAVIALCIFGGIFWLSNRGNGLVPSFVVNAYDAWKNKFCYQINHE